MLIENASTMHCDNPETRMSWGRRGHASTPKPNTHQKNITFISQIYSMMFSNRLLTFIFLLLHWAEIVKDFKNICIKREKLKTPD